MRSNPVSLSGDNTAAIHTLSPLDGRYFSRTKSLRKYFSEAALTAARIKVEVEYLLMLSKWKIVRNFTTAEKKFLQKLITPSVAQLSNVKELESVTHHDVKAVEYFLRQEIEKNTLKDVSSFIHFGITSEDVNNLAFRLMVKGAVHGEILPILRQNLQAITHFSDKYSQLPMLARTHGQPAVPTTLGKEILVFGIRLMTQIERLEKLQFQAKFNGAVGGYQAQVFALPSVDWLALNKELVTSLGFEFSELTTQVSFNEDLVELFTILHQVNSIFIDFNQDIWRYISDDWLVQSTKKDQVGSSTMPQKVNPIDFENSEGNLELANALFELFARKLPVSRLQRDLSNSTIMRNIGSAFGYSLLAYTSLHRGLGKISANEVVISQSLNKNYNILAEAWQTLARANGDNQAYEKLAMLSKNTALSKEKWQQLTANIDSRLSNLTPETYLGLSVFLTKKYLKKINQYLKISRHEKGSSE